MPNRRTLATAILSAAIGTSCAVKRPTTAPAYAITPAPAVAPIAVDAAPAADESSDGLRLSSGLRVRLFDIGQPMDRLYAIAPDQTPNVETIVPTLDLTSWDDFGKLRSDFRTEVTTTLRIRTPGTYTFRLYTDDGGILSIDGTSVVQWDGLHAADPREGQIELTEGDHELRLEHF